MELFFFFLPGVDVSHVYVGAWALGCFYSHISTRMNLSEGADRVGGQLRGDKDRVPLQWRNQIWQSLEKGAGKRCSESGFIIHMLYISTLLTIVPKKATWLRLQ